MKFAVALTMIGALALAGCSGTKAASQEASEGGSEEVASAPSETLDGAAGYQKVPYKWKEQPDEIYGPKKLLVYSATSKDFRTRLAFSCENAKVNAIIVVDGSNPISHDAKATVRIGANEPEDMRFVYNANDIGLRPNDGSHEAARAFLDKLAGSKDVAIKLNEVMGMPSSDPAMAFDLTGINEVRNNLDLACKAQATA